MKASAFLFSIVGVLIGCSDTKTTTGKSNGSEILYQQQWNVIALNGKNITSPATAYLNFTAGQINRVSGSTGCNRLTGVYELSGTNSINFLPVAVTKMACLDSGANETETRLLSALQQSSSWTATADELVLSNGTVELARLRASKPTTSDEKNLNGSWELSFISEQKIALDGLFPNKKPFISFNIPNMQASGNGGCNGFGCKVKVDGSKISISNILSTMMACEGNGEPIFFRTLEKVTNYSIGPDNSLTMLTGDIAVMKFVKK